VVEVRPLACVPQSDAAEIAALRAGDGFQHPGGAVFQLRLAGLDPGARCLATSAQSRLRRLSFIGLVTSHTGKLRALCPGRRPLIASEEPSPQCGLPIRLNRALPRLAGSGHALPKRSNSPLRTPPINACHSSGVNRRTEPSGFLLSRTPISPPLRFATSTQLPFEKLRELLNQCASEPGLTSRPPGLRLSMFLPRCVSFSMAFVTDYIE